MNGEDIGELAALWSTPAPETEQREWEAIARRTPRRAWLVQASELGFVAIIALCIIAAMIWRMGAATLATGSIILLLLAWSAWNRHQLARSAMATNPAGRAAFLACLVQAKEAELRRSAIGLALILPGAVLAALLGFAVQVDPVQVSFAAFLPQVMLTARGIVALAFLGGAVMMLTLTHLRLAGELARLRALRQAELDELQMDQEGLR